MQLSELASGGKGVPVGDRGVDCVPVGLGMLAGDAVG